MSIEIKSILLLIIGAAITGLIFIGWQEGERQNKIIATIIAVISSIAFLIIDAYIMSRALGIAVLVIAAAAAVYFVTKKHESAEGPKGEFMGVPMGKPATTAQPARDRAAEEEDFGDEVSFEDKETPAETDDDISEPEEEEPVKEEKKKVVYQDGLIGKPVHKEDEPAKEEAKEPATEPKIDEESSYQQHITAKLSDSSAQRNAGVSLKEKGLVDQAIEKWEEALKINPDDFKSVNHIANAYKEKGRLDDAAEMFKKAIKINPKDAEAHYALGFDYSARGIINEAIGSFESFIDSASPEDAGLVSEVERMIEHLKGQIST